MHICWKFTGDGLLAFAGGALALIGVWWSNHQSVKNLQKQLAAERNGRSEEVKRQIKSLARAFLFEIEDFYHYSLKLEPNWEKNVFKFRRWPFLMYQANAGRIGEFDDRTTKAIIKFYGDAEAYQACFEELVASKVAAEALALLTRLREIFPALKRSAESVCTNLADVAGVPRTDLRVPLSGLEDSGETERKVQETAHNA
jgi:hypothetical protein